LSVGKNTSGIAVSTPGRICLFGEHQDYLHLPVIPCAISLRLTIEGTPRRDSLVHLSLPDIGSEVSFQVGQHIDQSGKRDFFRSAMTVLAKHGLSFPGGFECTVHGEIPIRAGASSSSAMVVAWICFLASMSDQHITLSGEDCARYAYEAEVLEVGGAGGMMDQYASACGGVFFLTSYPQISLESLHPTLTSFVLGDSCQPKDTQGLLSSTKQRVVSLVNTLSRHDSNFSLQSATLDTAEELASHLRADEYRLLRGTLRNRDITYQALDLLRQPIMNERVFGELLNEHHAILRDVLCISTPKIEKMLTAALDAGAYGGKINGSGGGGCMFVYAPEHTERIAEAIEKAGGKSYIVNVDTGVRIESI